MSKFLFNKTLIIGLGLIGGSFAKSLVHHKISPEIFAYDLDLEAIDLAKNDQVIVAGLDNLALFEDRFDLIVIASPLSTYEEIFSEISAVISPHTIIIDLGSLKNFIGEILPKNLSKNFVSCHPIAGSEKTGFENSYAELFQNKKFIICPQNSDQNSVEKITEIVKKIGANVDFIDSKTHDEIYALVSHLPQFLSFLTKEFSPKNIQHEFFKKVFRLDDSDPEIWSDIFELNAENLEKFYIKFFDNLAAFFRNKSAETWQKKLENVVAKNGCNKTLNEIENKFFEENFAAIFFRAAVAANYLEISEIKTLQNYAGSGFYDFTSIMAVLNYDPEKIKNLIIKNQSKILKFFTSIS